MTTAPRYRLLVVDVDGTLLDRSFEVRPRVRRALAAAREHGTSVALCTGRPLESCVPIIADLDLSGPHIMYDGALVRDPSEQAAVMRRPPLAASLARLVGFAREHDVCLELYTDDHVYVERRWEESELHARLVRVCPLRSSFDDLLATGQVIKGQLITHDPVRRSLVEGAADRIQHELRFSWAKPPPGYEGLDFVNVVHPEVSKGEALLALAAYYGIDLSLVAAIGDGPNDISLLRAAGLGIAMGNAGPDVRAIADRVTADIEDDGLALAVERYILPGASTI